MNSPYHIKSPTIDETQSKREQSSGLTVIIRTMARNDCRTSDATTSINYSFAPTPFGEIFIASTNMGICRLEFTDNHDDSLSRLQRQFPSFRLYNVTDSVQQRAISALNRNNEKNCNIELHIVGTEFQMKVWHELLKIPFGKLATYGDIASRIGHPKAFRAVGSAVGENPVAYFIPCHRVVRADGNIGNYRWGKQIKSSILKWESAG